MNRRQTLQTIMAASALPSAFMLGAQDRPDAAALLRAGECVLMLRHAQTEAGVGDPPNFQLSQCSTQRNLSGEGRAQSIRIGQWFAARKLVVGSVQSSAWCRCKDTAGLAFGQFEVLPALSSTFDSRGNQVAQTEAMRQRLKGIRAGQFEVWVTHQVNIYSFTGEGPSMGEAFVVKLAAVGAPGRVLARTSFT
ncbi:MAG: histidine phosphatase family protein [Polaromonas sp.]|nr:histidine phosphatase family protein [Polaromonas sp.]